MPLALIVQPKLMLVDLSISNPDQRINLHAGALAPPARGGHFDSSRSHMNSGLHLQQEGRTKAADKKVGEFLADGSWLAPRGTTKLPISGSSILVLVPQKSSTRRGEVSRGGPSCSPLAGAVCEWPFSFDLREYALHRCISSDCTLWFPPTPTMQDVEGSPDNACRRTRDRARHPP